MSKETDAGGKVQRKSRGTRKKEDGKKNKKRDKSEDEIPDDIIVDEFIEKDFAFLMNAPISENDHFVFKSEKSWSVDVNKYSEFFLLDLKTISAAMESIPFTENVNIENKYFTNDQLTNIYNKAEKGKENYKRILDNLDAQDSTKDKDTQEKRDSVDETTEDLDFLLSLQEPVARSSMIVKPLPTSYNSDNKSATKSVSTKPMDLENWLDSILDD